LERSRSSSDVPAWARHWQRLMFDNGWLLPGYPPEFGGRIATLLQQYVHQQELARRRVYLSLFDVMTDVMGYAVTTPALRHRPATAWGWLAGRRTVWRVSDARRSDSRARNHK
jgi:alkylation response protein AidB-like acyl-CoA dehydrogenase